MEKTAKMRYIECIVGNRLTKALRKRKNATKNIKAKLRPPSVPNKNSMASAMTSFLETIKGYSKVM